MTHQTTEQVQCYYSKAFNVICERQAPGFTGTFALIVIHNATNVTLEVQDNLTREMLYDAREELVMKYLLAL